MGVLTRGAVMGGRAGWMVVWVAIMVMFGCDDIQYRQAAVSTPGDNGAQGGSGAEEEVRTSRLYPGPCLETQFDVASDAVSSEYTYTYNADGQLERLTYLEAGESSGGTWVFEYDALGLRRSMFNPLSGLERYDYNPLGYMASKEFSSEGVVQTLALASYDRQGRLERRELYNPAGRVLDEMRFVYDEAASRVEEQRDVGLDGVIEERVVRFYDALGQNPVPWPQDGRSRELGCTRRFCYGPSLGWLLREEFYVRDNADPSRFGVFEYDEQGNLMSSELFLLGEGQPYTIVSYDYSCWL